MITYWQSAWKCNLPKPATPLTKLVLLKLADHADEKGCCFPSIQRITKDTGMGRSTVLLHLQYLESAGLVRRQPGHTGWSTTYTLSLAAMNAHAHDEERVRVVDPPLKDKSASRTYRVQQVDLQGPADGLEGSNGWTPTVMESSLKGHGTAKGGFLEETLSTRHPPWPGEKTLDISPKDAPLNLPLISSG